MNGKFNKNNHLENKSDGLLDVATAKASDIPRTDCPIRAGALAVFRGQGSLQRPEQTGGASGRYFIISEALAETQASAFGQAAAAQFQAWQDRSQS